MSDPDTGVSQITYESEDSTTMASPTNVIEETAEADIEEHLYGKNKPRRLAIERKIVHDEDKPVPDE